MKKAFSIIVVLLCVLSIVLVSLFYLVPSFYENRYQEETTLENLYKLCDYVYTFHNSDLILKYYPKLIFETEYDKYSWENEKDNMMTKLLKTALNNSDFDIFKDYLSKSYVTYSTTKFAEISIIEFIYGYYDQYADLNNTYELFDIMIDTCPDIVSQFVFCQEYAEFVNLYTDDAAKFEEVNDRKKKLVKKVKEYWEQSRDGS